MSMSTLLLAFLISFEIVSVPAAAAVDEWFALVVIVVVEVARHFLVARALVRFFPAW